MNSKYTKHMKMIVDVIEKQNDYKASELSEEVAKLHLMLCKNPQKSLTMELVNIAKHVVRSPVTGSDFAMFASDVIEIINNRKQVNLNKYGYIPWLDFMKTGKVAPSTLDRNDLTVGPPIEYDKDTELIVNPEEEIGLLMEVVGIEGTLIIYGLLIYIRRG